MTSHTFPTIEAAAQQWAKDAQGIVDQNPNDVSQSLDATFVILDSETYSDPVDIKLPPIDTTPRRGCSLEIRSEQGMRPIIGIKGGSSLTVTGPQNSKNPLPSANLIIDGLLFDNTPLTINDGDLASLSLRQCTLRSSQAKSISIAAGNNNLVMHLDRVIAAGTIDSYSQKQSEASLEVCGSIIDGGSSTGTAMSCYELTIKNSTVFGRIDVETVDLASNSIFTGEVTVRRRQEGCVRFSYIPDGSKTPRRYRSQPTAAKILKPSFTSTRYGDPGYAQLYKDAPPEIFEGADNGNEMGAFNYLGQATLITNLNAALTDYTRFGVETGVFLVT